MQFFFIEGEAPGAEGVEKFDQPKKISSDDFERFLEVWFPTPALT